VHFGASEVRNVVTLFFMTVCTAPDVLFVEYVQLPPEHEK
jgi:hypothetical protein